MDRQGETPPVLGARPSAADAVEFRVWAPNASSVTLALDDAEHALVRDADGLFTIAVPAALQEPVASAS